MTTELVRKYPYAAIEIVDDLGNADVRHYPLIEIVRHLEDEESYIAVRLDDGYYVREIPINEDLDHSELLAKATTSESGYDLAVRPVQESDGYFVPGFDHPMPVPVIVGLLNGDSMPDQLAALVDDDGDVITLMLSSDSGLYLRFDGAWRYLPPDVEPNPIDGLTVVDVKGTAVDAFDSVDTRGGTVSVAKLPLADGETYDGVVRIDASAVEDDDPVLSAATIMSRPRTQYPIVASTEDIPSAVEIAMTDPSVRWYVEKRIRALGVDVEIPWNEQ